MAETKKPVRPPAQHAKATEGSRKYWASLTPEQRRAKLQKLWSANGRAEGRAPFTHEQKAEASASRKKYWASLTPEQRAKAVDKMAAGRRGKKGPVAPEKREKLRENARKAREAFNASTTKAERDEVWRKGRAKAAEQRRKRRVENPPPPKVPPTLEERRATARKQSRAHRKRLALLTAEERRQRIERCLGAHQPTKQVLRELGTRIAKYNKNLPPVLRSEGARLANCRRLHGFEVYDCSKCSQKTRLSREQWLKWLSRGRELLANVL